MQTTGFKITAKELVGIFRLAKTGFQDYIW